MLFAGSTGDAPPDDSIIDSIDDGPIDDGPPEGIKHDGACLVHDI